MNTYKPLQLIMVDKNGEKSSVLIREYALYNIDLSKLILNGEYQSIEVRKILNLSLYDGFMIEHDGTRYVAHDLRVNEGMCFAHEFEGSLKLMIENYLHDLALEEEKERGRKAAQLAKEKNR